VELLVFMVCGLKGDGYGLKGDGYGLKGDGYGLKGFSSCSIVPICDDIFKLLD
jgi:hypothetical protein